MPCQSNSPVQPGTGQRPSPLPRIGTRPGAMKPMWPAVSAYSTFCCGVPLPRAAATNAGQSRAAPRSSSASMLTSSSASAVQLSARTWSPSSTATVGGQQVGQHRAVPGRAHPQGHGLAALDPDDLVAGRERRRAVRRQILRRIVRIDPLDEQVLGVGAGIGEAPGDGAVVAQHHARQARHGGADQLALGRLEVREVPGPGRAQAQMRVVREQRRAARGAAAIQHPGVRAQARRRRRRQRRGERIGRQPARELDQGDRRACRARPATDRRSGPRTGAWRGARAAARRASCR